MIPFGTGGRICGGMNLAHYMLRIGKLSLGWSIPTTKPNHATALIGVIRNFDVVIPAECTPEVMACNFAFVSRSLFGLSFRAHKSLQVLLPAGQKCPLVFKPRKE